MRKDLHSTVALLLKAIFYSVVTAIFFALYSLEQPWLLRLSRTTGVTLVTFGVLIITLATSYGGFAIGKNKSRPIMYNMIIATAITDVISSLQLSIMNTHSGYKKIFTFIASPVVLMMVFATQIVFIVLFTYFSNNLYFRLKAPEKSCIITNSEADAKEIISKISRFKRQYTITEVIRSDAKDIKQVINRNETVFIYEIPLKERNTIITYCYGLMKNIYYNFEICDIVSYGSKPFVIDDKALVSAEINGLTLPQRFIKRLLDLMISIASLILASPIMLVCAIAIKLEDGGKVFFKQKRATINGKTFNVFKFRTMKEENSVNKSVTVDDDRITKVGAILRKFRVDELPQIINIIKGDMSVVGPRPEMLENVKKYTSELPEFSYRLRVKAGLTGYAQIAGKYNTTPKDKLMMDLMYIEKYSIWQDIKLIFQTVTVFLKSEQSTEAFDMDSDNNANSAEELGEFNNAQSNKEE